MKRYSYVNIIRIIFVGMFIIMIGACGKKTAPISKDSITLPVPEKFVLKNTDKGVYIKNNDQNIHFLWKKHLLMTTIVPQVLDL